MDKLGFSSRWINWIMFCVSTVNYSVLVNNDMVGPIVLGRGLRQGDPLSPYLFIIYAQGLSSMIKKAEARGDLHGIKICRSAPIISHLFFANDSFLFFRANIRECKVMKSIVTTYEEASSQSINFIESEFFDSRMWMWITVSLSLIYWVSGLCLVPTNI